MAAGPLIIHAARGLTQSLANEEQLIAQQQHAAEAMTSFSREQRRQMGSVLHNVEVPASSRLVVSVQGVYIARVFRSQAIRSSSELALAQIETLHALFGDQIEPLIANVQHMLLLQVP
jgi:hypothetical protein